MPPDLTHTSVSNIGIWFSLVPTASSAAMGSEISLIRYFEFELTRNIHEQRLTWQPMVVRMPAPVKLRGIYQHSFKGRLFAIGRKK